MIQGKINYSDITFVIPSLAPDDIPTIESIPSECPYIVRGDDTRGKARNKGVAMATTPYIVFADSDITFTQTFLDYCIGLMEDNVIVGLQGYYPSPFLISRFMMFPRKIWEDVGPLQEVQHGEETEWCIRAVDKGYKLVGVPRESVYHHPHVKSEYKKEYNNLLWLLKLHPAFPFRVLKSVFYKMSRSNYDDDTTLKFKD